MSESVTTVQTTSDNHVIYGI